MARFTEYDPDAVFGELDSLLECMVFLESEIEITKKLKDKVLEARPELAKSIKLQAPDIRDSLTVNAVQIAIIEKFDSEFHLLTVSRRRLGHLLENGDVHILNCDQGTREFLNALWRCIEQLPTVTLAAVNESRIVKTDFEERCRERGFPDRSVTTLSDLFAEHRRDKVPFPKGMHQKTKDILFAFAGGATNEEVSLRFNISATNSRNKRSANRALIQAIKDGMIEL